jgi:hypothetical protein
MGLSQEILWATARCAGIPASHCVVRRLLIGLAVAYPKISEHNFSTKQGAQGR